MESVESRDRIEASESEMCEPWPPPNFAVCPECKGYDGTYTYSFGRECWGACHEHKVRWLISSESDWERRDEAAEEAWPDARAFLDQYEDITIPW